ncbi:MAG: hypothetical protein H6738_02450 [Alphaproteobacteria bacterium]|nr:hypothetical protein [Alphaproteobacteria bacterium]MCB9695631.1 hypothetical protein [Alphaproteobacteria bacterium]
MLPILMLLACDMGPSFSQVQEIDTIEAYEEFLAKDPDGVYKFAIEKRLEELYFERGQKEMTTEAWQAYLDRFPEGASAEKAKRELATAMYSDAVKQDTVEAYEAFLEKNRKGGDKWLVARAKGRIAVLQYGGISMGEPKVERVNMAEDPKGELNGWGVSVEVTNDGDKTLEYVSITLEYMADEGYVLAAKDYPLVSKTWSLPASDEQMRPIKPKEKRTWLWTESDEQVPKGWNQKVKLNLTGLRFVE